MKLPYEPAAKLAGQLLERGLVKQIWARDISAWGAQPGSTDAKSIEKSEAVTATSAARVSFCIATSRPKRPTAADAPELRWIGGAGQAPRRRASWVKLPS